MFNRYTLLHKFYIFRKPLLLFSKCRTEAVSKKMLSGRDSFATSCCNAEYIGTCGFQILATPSCNSLSYLRYFVLCVIFGDSKVRHVERMTLCSAQTLPVIPANAQQLA